MTGLEDSTSFGGGKGDGDDPSSWCWFAQGKAAKPACLGYLAPVFGFGRLCLEVWELFGIGCLMRHVPW